MYFEKKIVDNESTSANKEFAVFDTLPFADSFPVNSGARVYIDVTAAAGTSSIGINGRLPEDDGAFTLFEVAVINGITAAGKFVVEINNCPRFMEISVTLVAGSITFNVWITR